MGLIGNAWNQPIAAIRFVERLVYQATMTILFAPGEHIIWQGQPAQGIRLAPQDAFAIPFAAVWLFIVVAGCWVAITGDTENVDPFFYIMMPLFLLLGLYMLIGRFVVDKVGRRRTHYHLTNQRALIESGLFRQSRRSVSLAAVPEIRFRAGRKGRGTVQFGSSGPFGMLPPSWPGASQYLPPAFDDIEAAEHVYGLALSAQRAAQGGR